MAILGQCLRANAGNSAMVMPSIPGAPLFAFTRFTFGLSPEIDAFPPAAGLHGWRLVVQRWRARIGWGSRFTIVFQPVSLRVSGVDGGRKIRAQERAGEGT